MEEIKKYANKQFLTLFEQLSLYEIKNDEEILHKVRVSLKKIKAVFRLISFCSNGFYLQKEYIQLKKIFREAGKIREFDEACKLLNEYNVSNIQAVWDTKERVRLISEFILNIPGYKEIISLQSEIPENHFENISSNCLSKFISAKKEELQNNIYPLLIESKLHKSRKIIKDIIYLSSISRLRKKNLNPLYDEIQELIGKWHDKIILLDWIKEKNMDPGGIIAKKLNYKTRSDLKAIGKLIMDLYNSDKP